MIPISIQKARNKITEIESQHSIESLRHNHNGYQNILRRMKKGESISNDFSKDLYLLYRTYLRSCTTVKKYKDKNNIVEVEKEPSPTNVILNAIIKPVPNRQKKLSSIRRRLFPRHVIIGGDCKYNLSCISYIHMYITFKCLASHTIYRIIFCLASHTYICTWHLNVLNLTLYIESYSVLHVIHTYVYDVYTSWISHCILNKIFSMSTMFRITW